METTINTIKLDTESRLRYIGRDLFDRLWDEGWIYVKTVVDAMREPVLVLDKDLNIMAANETFYKKFRVTPDDTVESNVYELGNGQWDIPELRNLLEDILPQRTFLKDFKVTHYFPTLGRKTMIVNARQIHFKRDIALELFPPIILLTIEDITEHESENKFLDTV